MIAKTIRTLGVLMLACLLATTRLSSPIAHAQEKPKETRHEVLRDRNYNRIGEVEIRPDGSKTLRDRNYSVLGYYDAATNVTRDRNYSLVGHGDILTSLLPTR